MTLHYRLYYLPLPDNGTNGVRGELASLIGLNGNPEEENIEPA